MPEGTRNSATMGLKPNTNAVSTTAVRSFGRRWAITAAAPVAPSEIMAACSTRSAHAGESPIRRSAPTNTPITGLKYGLGRPRLRTPSHNDSWLRR